MSDDYIAGKQYRNRLSYPNKFLSLGDTHLPQDIKELIKLCRIFYYSNPLIRNIVDKMAEYPVSDLILSIGSDTNRADDVKQKTEDILNINLNIKRKLLEFGINYFVNGSVIVSMNLDFKRNFKCNSCNTIFDPEESADFKVKSLKKKILIVGHCPRCNSTSAVLEVHDIYKKNADSLNIILWNPLELEVEYNQWNGKKTFMYTPPPSMKARLLTSTKKKDKKFLLTLPKIYFEAIEKEQSIELDAYHLGTPELAQDKTGFNIPVVVSVLKDVWYYQTLRRAQESILSEHVVPFRSVFPQPQGQLDPFTMMRMDKWKSFISEQIDLWKKDHNHMMISPIPVGSANIGGDAKFLMMTNELRLIEENIISGFGAPLELVKGGVSWSGTSVSLRILENHFLSFRKDLEIMLNTFILPKISKLLDMPAATVKFSRLRMSDDQQFKTLLLQLVQAGYLSLETLLEEIGFNAAEEKLRTEKEASWFNGIKEVRGLGEAELQGKQQQILGKYQVRTQESQMIEQALVQMRQTNAGQGKGVNPDIQELAVNFMNISSNKDRKQFLQEVQDKYGQEVLTQLVEYLQEYSKQERDPESAEKAKDKVNKQPDNKVESPPTNKSRPTAKTEERVKANRRNT